MSNAFVIEIILDEQHLLKQVKSGQGRSDPVMISVCISGKRLIDDQIDFCTYVRAF